MNSYLHRRNLIAGTLVVALAAAVAYAEPAPTADPNAQQNPVGGSIDQSTPTIQGSRTNQTNQTGQTSPDGSQAYVQRIREAILTDIRNNKTVNGQLQNLNVDVNQNGHIVVNGWVNTLEQRQLVMEITAKRAGKDAVVNQISIRPPQRRNQ